MLTVTSRPQLQACRLQTAEAAYCAPRTRSAAYEGASVDTVCKLNGMMVESAHLRTLIQTGFRPHFPPNQSA